MGLCESKIKAEMKAEKAALLAHQCAKRAWRGQGVPMLLILGTRGCGKSTILKQMKILYKQKQENNLGGVANIKKSAPVWNWNEKGYTREEREQYKAAILANIHSNIKVVLDNADNFTCLKDQLLVSNFRRVRKADQFVIHREIGGLLKAIWLDPGFQATWTMRSGMPVQDLLRYFMQQTDRIQEPDYLPTDQDILHSYVPTSSGIVEEIYQVNKIDFRMLDVGRQPTNRKKWLHYFDNVSEVIFVADISEYDQVARLDNAVNMFDEICNSKHFGSNKNLFLFLNKNDLFKEKLTKVPFRIDGETNQRFTDFKGPHIIPGTPSADMTSPEFKAGYNAASKYLVNLFLSRNQERNRIVYSHITCVTDTDNFEMIFGACRACMFYCGRFRYLNSEL